MEFQRGSDIKEATGIGRWSNAYDIHSLSVNFQFFIDGKGEDIQISHKTFIKEIEGPDLHKLLEYLHNTGIDKGFDDFLHEKVTELFVQDGNILRLYDLGKTKMVAAAVWYSNDEDTYRKRATLPWFIGKDVVYQGKLYEIKDDPSDPGWWKQ